MYLLSNEALQGHLEALYEHQIMSVGSSEPPRKKVSLRAKIRGVQITPHRLLRTSILLFKNFVFWLFLYVGIIFPTIVVRLDIYTTKVHKQYIFF